MKIYPVILSGGAGTRLWPLSRANYPKQFIPLVDGMEGSLLAATVRRLPAAAGFMAPTIVCSDAHRFLVRDELEDMAVEPRAIILEPVARNTAPAIAVAALTLSESNPDAVFVVMPSDHLIDDEAMFAASVRKAAEVAATGRLVLLGVTPAKPHTGYGYIGQGRALDGVCEGAFEVKAFHEKPDVETATQYTERPGYFWNSGIFVLHAASFLAELERHAPDVLHAAGEALAKVREDLGFLRLDREALEQSPNISIDYAVMEKTANAALLPLDVTWSDVGSWSALWELAEQDKDGNAVARPDGAMLTDTSNSYIYSQRALVATLGVDDLIIVDTPDALLVADKSRAQDVGQIVARLKTSNRPEVSQHYRAHRPWGWYEPLNVGPRFQVKLLHVKPKAKLSLQMHHHRSEHWVVVTGTAKVTVEGVETLVSENESVYISATQWHRLENPGKVPLEIIEVQLGSYLGEDDIVRSKDDYNRLEDE
jgi:mannose-1-phosphate guanylyltransferase / mannose-6-phosphate isomerase